MAAPQRKLDYQYTPEEYLAFERASDTKHEYLDGQIYAMAGASPTHNQICFNAIVAVGSQILDSTCIGYTSDQKIRTDPMDLFSYPDLTVVCGEPVFHDEQQDVILNPTVIIEVLSPRTENYDRSTKLDRYQNIRSLTDYILISQNRPCVEHYVRQKGKRQWLFTIETSLEAEIVIASIKCKLKLTDIYNRVKLHSAKRLLTPVDDSPKPAKRKLKSKKAR
ncbi:MAG: Uma2 family endonuclease [Acidobacteriota bacterium]|nr:Uma2 family endonuclease [Acidobacteriota bacterium]